ncbi:ATP-binding protein [Fischerella sp. JS2]|uniref:ATP-binding protein n=1 Tax=Fischerella sp. JS2 TaxID=2597771 RepID=UPI0028E3EF87|nr:ATP-binding protein [Fischerella sp. JS2]
MSSDREPVHFSGSIQPHGILLALSYPELTILQVSANIQDFFNVQPENLLGQCLDSLLNEQIFAAFRQNLADIDNISPFKLSIQISVDEQYFDGMVHRSANVIILELEPSTKQTNVNFFSVSALIKRAIAKLQQVSTSCDFFDLVTQEVRQLTGFDRVMVYQFNPQGAGEVIAEAKTDDLPPYLGLHYPATDIPQPVRELYTQGLLRFIPNLAVAAVDLVPAENPVTGQPLDLSMAVLRGVDSCCVEYHQNIGVAAILVIALIRDRQLWGLIACHHHTPKHIPYKIREGCELLGQFVSSELANKVNDEELDYILKLRSLQSEFIESISQFNDLKQALVNPASHLLELVNAQGAAICLAGEITLLGATPTLDQVRTLIRWANTQVSDVLFYSDSLPKIYPDAEAFSSVASGLLLLQISQVRQYSILWFRPEVLQTLTWAGDPHASMSVASDGSVTWSLRKSFARWQETVRFTSLPWKDCELKNALAIKSVIVSIVLNKADELAQINQELERSNQELDSFAYAASHDLKEPLRGIHNFSTLLLKGYESILDDTGKARLQTLLRLTRRMESLIDALLKFSRLGQAQLNLQPTDFNELVNRVQEDLYISRQDVQLNIRIPRPLPIVRCDSILISEVFINLLSNACKYNDKPEVWIEIGYLEEETEILRRADAGNLSDQVCASSSQSPITFYVRDNGIGIRERHLETVFRLFKRLHEQHLYEGGTGAGLTIAKKIIERHGGVIWVESIYGEGSTFYFTLPTY